MGVKVSGIYWTLGAFDGVIVCEAPDETTATAALLHLGSLGSIRTQTARAFDAAEMPRAVGNDGGVGVDERRAYAAQRRARYRHVRLHAVARSA